MDLRCVRLRGFLSIHDNWQPFVIYFDQVECILCDIPIFSDDDSHAHPCVRDTIDLQHARCVDIVLDAPGLRLPCTWKCRQFFEILAGEYGNDTRVFRGFVLVDAFDLCVRIWAAQNRCVHHAGKLDIIQIFGFARE